MRKAVFLDTDAPPTSGASYPGRLRRAVFLDTHAPPTSGASHPGRLRRAVFLDRDGVLNERRFPFVRRVGQLRLLPGAAEAAARLSRGGFAIVIATNQVWMGMGWLPREHHEAIMARVVGALEEAGAKVDGAYAAYDQGELAKPSPGMLLLGARELGLDLARSYMVGDNAKDMVAGRRAGTRTVLVDPRLRTRLQGAAGQADHVARDLPGAAEWILAQG